MFLKCLQNILLFSFFRWHFCPVLVSDYNTCFLQLNTIRPILRQRYEALIPIMFLKCTTKEVAVYCQNFFACTSWWVFAMVRYRPYKVHISTRCFHPNFVSIFICLAGCAKHALICFPINPSIESTYQSLNCCTVYVKISWFYYHTTM